MADPVSGIGKTADTFLARDMASMEQAQVALTAGWIGTTEPPEDADFLTNVHRDVCTDVAAMHFGLLQGRGYGIHFVDDAEAKSGRPLPDSLSVKVAPEHRHLAAAYILRAGLDEDIVSYRFLRAVTDRKLSTGVLDTSRSWYHEAMTWLEHIPSDQRNNQLKRGVLTASLLGRLLMQHQTVTVEQIVFREKNQDWIQPLDNANKAAYERLRHLGYEPFTAQEILDMAATVLDGVLPRLQL